MPEFPTRLTNDTKERRRMNVNQEKRSQSMEPGRPKARSYRTPRLVRVGGMAQIRGHCPYGCRDYRCYYGR